MDCKDWRNIGEIGLTGIASAHRLLSIRFQTATRSQEKCPYWPTYGHCISSDAPHLYHIRCSTFTKPRYKKYLPASPIAPALCLPCRDPGKLVRLSRWTSQPRCGSRIGSDELARCKSTVSSHQPRTQLASIYNGAACFYEVCTFYASPLSAAKGLVFEGLNYSQQVFTDLKE